MRTASKEYKEIMKRPYRNRGYMEVFLGLVNQNAQDGANIEGDLQPYSGTDVFSDRIYPDYITLEENYWRADGKMLFLPEDDTPPVAQNIITRDLFGSVTVRFDNTYDIKGLTIDFGDSYPGAFIVTTDIDTFVYENTESKFVTTDVFFETSSLTIQPVWMWGGQQRMRIKSLLMGAGLKWGNKEIATATIEEYAHAISEEKPYIKFNLTVLDPDNEYNVDSSTSTINFLETGQPVRVRMGLELDDENIEWLQMERLYLTGWNATRGKMQFTANDRVAFLNGKFEDDFRIFERTLYDEAVNIFTAAGMEPDEYKIDECLRDITVTNPMPKTYYAECLQLVANAGRCIVRQDSDGIIRIDANFANVLEPEDVSLTYSSVTDYSNPENVLLGSSVVYSDLTQDFWSADGSMLFLPEDNNYLEDTGFVSAEVADYMGLFQTNPNITLSLIASFVFYGITIVFDSNPPREMVIHTKLAEESQEDVVFNNLERGRNVLKHEFLRFDTLTLEFTIGAPDDRIAISRISFGDLSDYQLRIMDMKNPATGYKEERIKSVGVKVYTYKLDEKDEPLEVEDDVWVTENINVVGSPVEFCNPLISTQEHAQIVASWIANYYGNNISYDVDFRGEPRIEAGDIIYMESEELNNLQVEVQNTQITFNGAFSGKLALRRALRIKGVNV